MGFRYIAVIVPRVPVWAVWYDREADDIFTDPVISFGVGLEDLATEGTLTERQLDGLLESRGTTEVLQHDAFVIDHTLGGLKNPAWDGNFLGLTTNKETRKKDWDYEIENFIADTEDGR